MPLAQGFWPTNWGGPFAHLLRREEQAPPPPPLVELQDAEDSEDEESDDDEDAADDDEDWNADEDAQLAGVRDTVEAAEEKVEAARWTLQRYNSKVSIVSEAAEQAENSVENVASSCQEVMLQVLHSSSSGSYVSMRVTRCIAGVF